MEVDMVMAGSTGQEFWTAVERFASTSTVVIDRPRGARHPRYPELVYPFDYGYLQGTSGGDGDGIDVWVGGQSSRSVDYLIVTLDQEKRDCEVKILLGCSQQEAQEILAFQNGDSMRAILVRRHGQGLSWLRERRSIRRFTNQAVPAETVQQILEAATWAPSAHNRQPWRFAVLSTLDAKTRLAQAMGADFRRDLLADGLPPDEVDAQVERSHRRILEAPLAVLLCLDMSDMDAYPDPGRRRAEYLMGVQSVAMAGENLLLAVQAVGLGGVWVCAPLFTPETARAALDLPPDWQPQGILLAGYPAKTPAPRPRRPLEEVAVFL